MQNHGVVTALVHLLVPLDEIVPHPDNPNRGDVAVIADQMRAHGQHTPIVVQASSGRVIAGNHRRMAALELGWTHIAAVRVPWDDLQTLEVLLGDNLPARRARDDDEQLAKVLGKLASQADGLEGTGYDAADLAMILRRVRDAELADLTDPEQPGVALAWPTVRVECRHDLYRSWTELVRKAGGTESEVFADLVMRASE